MNPQGFLEALGRTSLQAAVLVLVVLLAQRVFRRQLAPRWRCALWLLVAIRLLLPGSLTSAASLFNLFPRGSALAAHGKPAFPSPPPATGAIPEVDQGAKTTTASPLMEAVGSEKESTGPEVAFAAPTAVPRSLHPEAAIPALSSKPPHSVSWPTVLLAVWLTGVVALAVYVLVTSWRMASRLRRSPPIEDPAVLAVLDECRAGLRMRTAPPLMESAEVGSPALFGWFRPWLLLPAGLTARFTTQELRHIFLHELAHLKRRDLLLNWLSVLLQIVHWFNPLLWLGFARWRADRELACDALALEAAGEGGNRQYGQTILRVLEEFARPATAPGLVGILEDRRDLPRRFRLIAAFKPGNRWGWFSVGLLALLAMVSLTDAQTEKAKGGPSTTVSAKAKGGVEQPVEPRSDYIGADPEPEIEHNEEVRTLTLTVLDAATGKPVAGAEVDAPLIGDWRNPPHRRLTDEHGIFVFRWLLGAKADRESINDFQLSAVSKGHARRSQRWRSSAGDVYAGLPQESTIALERGIAIGGLVQDERGQPLAGVRVAASGSNFRGHPLWGENRLLKEYSEVRTEDLDARPVVTDSRGGWTLDHFPNDLLELEVTFTRPDGARETFATSHTPNSGRPPRSLISLSDLHERLAIAKLGDGITVRGIVVDEHGRPLAGTVVREGYGHGNIMRTSETTTDADGRFEHPHRAPRQWIYTASRADRATASVVAEVRPGMGEVRLILPPARPVRLQAVSEDGHPIADAQFRLHPYRIEAQILDWSGTADAQGVAVWTNAPTTRSMLIVDSQRLRVSRQFNLIPGETSKRVVLSESAAEKINVTVNATDQTTHKPITVHRVSVNYGFGPRDFQELSQPDSSKVRLVIKKTAFSPHTATSYWLRIEAAGYENATTDRLDYEEGDQALSLTMSRAGGPKELQVLQPDGRTAARAQAWVRESAGGLPMTIQESMDSYLGYPYGKTWAGEDGVVALPGAPDHAPVVLAHQSGFLVTTMAALRKEGEARLKPFGRVEGRLLVAGRPVAGERVAMRLLSPSSQGLYLNYSLKTGPDGRFFFVQVPEGEYRLNRWASPMRPQPMGYRPTEVYQVPIEVKAGETCCVDYASAGRALVGCARSEPPGQTVDWRHGVQVLVLRRPGTPAVPRPNREDYATFAAFLEANDAAIRAEEQLRMARDTRTYPLVFGTNGTFRIEDVPPGIYDLRIRVTKPEEEEARYAFIDEDQAIELGSLVREVIVPAGTEPLDLGTLVVPVRGYRQARGPTATN